MESDTDNCGKWDVSVVHLEPGLRNTLTSRSSCEGCCRAGEMRIKITKVRDIVGANAEIQSSYSRTLSASSR
jgi:hypothetical protein